MVEQGETDDEEGDDRPDGGEASESVIRPRAGEGIDLSPAGPMLPQSGRGRIDAGMCRECLAHLFLDLQAAKFRLPRAGKDPLRHAIAVAGTFGSHAAQRLDNPAQQHRIARRGTFMERPVRIIWRPKGEIAVEKGGASVPSAAMFSRASP